MANTVIVLVKVMPTSPDVDLSKIKDLARKGLEAEGARSLTLEEKPIAFGLKAVMVNFAFPEEKGSDIVEEILSKIPEVSSITIEDYRRAFG